ncbi:MAG: hypothetical protein IJ518_05490 [Clostridia bacterium]|nr:hypothetical protein [Clostridia bacterium]
MDGFRGWAVVVCTAAVVCTLLRRLFPDTLLGQQGRMLLPCVFMCALLTPLPTLLAGIRLPTLPTAGVTDTAVLEARMQQQLTARVNASLLAMANQALEGYGWQAKKVVTDMDIGEDGSISMGQITLYVDERTARSSAAVRQVVEKRLGTEVVLALWEETP